MKDERLARAEAVFHLVPLAVLLLAARIALARGFHNESVTILNDRMATLPDLVVAKLTGFKPMELFRD